MERKQSILLAGFFISTVVLSAVGWEFWVEEYIGPEHPSLATKARWSDVLIFVLVALLSMCGPTWLLVRQISTSHRLEQRFRDFAENAFDGLWEMDADLRFTHVWGPTMEGLQETGQSPIGKTLWDYIGVDPEQEEDWRKHKEDLETRRAFHDFEYSYECKDGRHFRRISGTPIFEPDGGFAGYRGSVQNLTETVQAEAAARRVQERLEYAVRNLPIGIALYDADDRLITRNNVNRDFVSASGLVRPGTKFEELLRGAVNAGVLAEAVGREEEFIRERLERHRNPSEAFEQVRGDRILEIREHLLPDGGTMVVQTDVTEKRTAEDALRRSEEILRLFMDAANDRFEIFDRDLTYLEVNQASIDACGRPKVDIIGKKMEELSPTAKTSGRYDKYLEVIRTGEPCRFEAPFVHPASGREAYYSITAFKVGEGLGIVSQDVTERKLAEEDLRKSEERFSKAFHGGPGMKSIIRVSDETIIDVSTTCGAGAWDIHARQ